MARAKAKKKSKASEFPVIVKKLDDAIFVHGYNPHYKDFVESATICKDISKRMGIKAGYGIVTIQYVNEEEFKKYLKIHRYPLKDSIKNETDPL